MKEIKNHSFFMKIAGTIYQNFPNYIDHIAPICSLLDIPIVISEKEFDDIIKKFYPDIKVILHENYLTYPKFLFSNFNTIISCQFLYSDIRCVSLSNLHSQNYNFVWIPHGNSDKGRHSKIFKILQNEKTTLVYGQNMLDAFKQQMDDDKIMHKFIIGNYRKHYHLKHKSFYNSLIKEEITKKLSKGRKTILYAPTWEDYENNGSYQDVISTLLETLPEDFNLIVKPHHNTYLKYATKMLLFHAMYEDHPNILFLKDFPTIYPLLDFIDIYLGDMSSIGYDFLTFNKPMFFLNRNSKEKKDPSLFLFKTGFEIKPKDFSRIYEIISNNIQNDNRFEKVRKKIESYTFGDVPDFIKLKKELQKISE